MLPKGKYVVAVSGGVDSVALLHALRNLPGVELVVAHFDHGIRPESAADREFVGRLAGLYGLPFEYAEGGLGPDASEATAREARYRFLDEVRKRHAAAAMVTAHHKDDVLETAVINLLRGSGRKGLTALGNRAGIERPLLEISKQDLIDYAQSHNLEWREDSTNQDTDYLRNYVRHQLLSRFDDDARGRLWQIINGLKATNEELDELLAEHIADQSQEGELDRGWFVQLPHPAARETMAAWLRGHGIRDFDSKTLERLVVGAKTAAAGKSLDVSRGVRLHIGPYHLALDSSSDTRKKPPTEV